MVTTVQTNFLATHLDHVPANTTAAIDALRLKYPNVKVAPCVADNTLLRIGGADRPGHPHSVMGGLDIHPTVLNGLSDDRQQELVQGICSNDARARQAVIDSFQRSGNERYRFDETYQTTIEEIGSVPAQLDGFQILVARASPDEKHRMAQIQISHGSTEVKGINTRGVELAMQMGATTGFEVMSYVEFFHKLMEPRRQVIKDQVNQLPLPVRDPPMSRRENQEWRRQQVNERLLNEMGAQTLDPQLFQQVSASIREYTDVMVPYCGPPYADPALDGANNDATKAILEANADNLRFSDRASGGYHLKKHFVEMYQQLHAGNLVQQAIHYITEARRSISQSEQWGAAAGQTGKMSFEFRRGGHKSYVPVNGQQANLASFF